MTTKHTPGPWRTIQEPGARLLTIIAKERKVASVETDADAALIAEAPAMADAIKHALAVLRNIADQAGDVPFWNDGGDGRECAKQLRASLSLWSNANDRGSMNARTQVIWALYEALRDADGQSFITSFSCDGDNDSAELIVDTPEGSYVITSAHVREAC
jgi:hypothetical protein